jgi:uncharacterized membrane protein
MAERLRLPGGGLKHNLGQAERIASVVGGAALAALAARRRGVPGALLGAVGAVLLQRGVTGHCFVYDALDVDRRHAGGAALAGDDADEGVSVTATVTINRPADELYAFWRDFRNAPRFMDRILSVKLLDEDGTRSRWTAAGPMGRSWEWDSQVTGDSPGELIAWESLAGSDLPNRGWVQFAGDASGRRTEVRYFVEFDPPLGVIGEAIASAFEQVPRVMIRDDLRRFRALMEAGQTAAAPGRQGWTDAEAEE